MRRASLLTGVILVLAQAQTIAEEKKADANKGDKVQVIVHSWLLPGTLASELKSGASLTGAKLTDVVVEEAKATDAELTDITKGEGDMPKMGMYHQQKMTVFRGEKYDVHDAYLSKQVPKGTKLKDFMLKGTFTAKIDGKAHKFAWFEATASKP